MKDALKNIGADLAAEIVSHFASDAVRSLLESTKAASDSETGTFEVVITTENLDRYQEVIKLDGWDLTHYRNNPVVLWGHDHNSPIGVATSIDITDGKMVARGKFAPTEKAQEVRKLYDFGIIRATSVGFIEKEREGNLITKAELLEFSFVSVPANPYALSLAMEKSLSLDGLVTKGFMHVEKELEDETVVETVPESEEVVAPTEDQANCSECDQPADADPEFQSASYPICKACLAQGWTAVAQLRAAAPGLKAALVALEALGVKSEEPEGDADDDAGTQAGEEEGIKNYLALKGLFQSVDTALGDVLAELRQAGARR